MFLSARHFPPIIKTLFPPDIRDIFFNGAPPQLQLNHVRRPSSSRKAPLCLSATNQHTAGCQSHGVGVGDLLIRLGPTFIKAGQVLANRPDVIRMDYMQELTLLQSRAVGHHARSPGPHRVGCCPSSLLLLSPRRPSPSFYLRRSVRGWMCVCVRMCVFV